MDKFKTLNTFQIKRLTPEDRVAYHRQAIEYYGNLKDQLKNYKTLEKIHPLLLLIAKLYPINIYELNEIQWPNDGGPVIFTVNHSNSNDFPVLARLIKEHFFIMADYTMQNDFFVNLINKLNGVIYVDRESKKSGQNALSQSIDGVNKGYNMAIFSELTWNLLKKVPMLPRKWGDIKIAKGTSRPLLPITLEYNFSNCYVNYGKLRYVSKDDDLKEIDRQVFDEMSDLRKTIWESKIYRDTYKDVDYDSWLINTIKGYKNFDVEYEMSLIRKDSDYYSKEFEHILQIAEQIRPVAEIEKRLKYSKINYRLK